jgi:hypothetical protein
VVGPGGGGVWGPTVRWGRWVGPDCQMGWDPRVWEGWWGLDVNQLDTKSEYMICGSQIFMSNAAIYKLN